MIDWRAYFAGEVSLETMDGKPVVIYTTDVPGEWPIHGRIVGETIARSWNIDGFSSCGRLVIGIRSKSRAISI